MKASISCWKLELQFESVCVEMDWKQIHSMQIGILVAVLFSALYHWQSHQSFQGPKIMASPLFQLISFLYTRCLTINHGPVLKNSISSLSPILIPDFMRNLISQPWLLEWVKRVRDYWILKLRLSNRSAWADCASVYSRMMPYYRACQSRQLLT